MNARTWLFIAALGTAAIAGCYTGPGTELSPAMRGPSTSTDGTDPEAAGIEGTDPDGGPAAAEGLPCDVAKLLAASCTDCHGSRLSNGAPNSLVTYEDLTAPSETDPSRTVAEDSLARMKATKKPMPPEGALGAADVAILEKWIGAGMPKGSCGAKTATPDGGPVTSGDAAAPKDAAPDASSVCTSGTTAAAGITGPLMQPGKACIACHSATGAKAFQFAGTVYPTLHEPNGCNGDTSGDLTVVLVDAAGVSHSMPVNAAGNFVRVTSMPLPYKAMIVNGTKTRRMMTPQTDGDCNGCHSEWGTHSPGRIMAP